MEAQEIFTTAVTGVYQQGKKSENAYGCVYRGPEGLKCAVGFLLTDDEAMGLDIADDSSVGTLIDDEALPAWMNPHRELLKELQEAHDYAIESHFREDFIDEAKIIAERHDLKMPEVTR